jgi:hypothetical protein
LCDKRKIVDRLHVERMGERRIPEIPGQRLLRVDLVDPRRLSPIQDLAHLLPGIIQHLDAVVGGAKPVEHPLEIVRIEITAEVAAAERGPRGHQASCPALLKHILHASSALHVDDVPGHVVHGLLLDHLLQEPGDLVHPH